MMTDILTKIQFSPPPLEPPERIPLLFAPQGEVDEGVEVKALCYSAPTTPASQIHFLINNLPVSFSLIGWLVGWLVVWGKKLQSLHWPKSLLCLTKFLKTIAEDYFTKSKMLEDDLQMLIILVRVNVVLDSRF